MPNMSYCRFENTCCDLQDCQRHMNEELSDIEEMYRKQLIDLCQSIGEMMMENEDEEDEDAI